MKHIGIDLGGTKIAAGIVNDDMRITAHIQVPTDLPKEPEDLADEIFELAERLLKSQNLSFDDLDSVGVGIPSTVNQEKEMVEYANNFGFINVPFVRMLRERFPCPVYAENDAKAAAWGEYLAGSGCGSESMVAVTLGTGVGGGLILNGKILDGANRAAGEIGHMVIHRGGRQCNCGRRGCLEAYASATALVKAGKRAALKYPQSLLNRLCGDDRKNINGKIIFDAAKEGDTAANEVLNRYLDDLAEGVVNIINIIQPELVCIGGGLSGAGEQLLEPLRERVEPMVYSRNSEKNARIVAASLGNDAGIIGASQLYRLYGSDSCFTK